MRFFSRVIFDAIHLINVDASSHFDTFASHFAIYNHFVFEDLRLSLQLVTDLVAILLVLALFLLQYGPIFADLTLELQKRIGSILFPAVVK